MFKKLFGLMVALILCISPVTASAASSHGFGGFHSSSSYGSSRSFSSSRSYGFGGGSSYHSGYQAPSSRVGRSYSAPSSGFFGSSRSGIGSHLFSFGAGFMLGNLFHPFGGYYGGGFGMGGYGYHSFSLIGLLFDILLLYIIYRIVRRIFRRR